MTNVERLVLKAIVYLAKQMQWFIYPSTHTEPLEIINLKSVLLTIAKNDWERLVCQKLK